MKRRIVLLLAAVLLYAGMVTATWFIATHHAHRKAETLLDNAMEDLDSTINDSVATMLMHVAESIVDELGEAKPLSPERAKIIADQRDIDEFNVIDRDGRVIASADPHLVGVSMMDFPTSAEFMVLTKGKRHAFTQPFRPGAHNPDVRRKYVGVPFPNGDGIIQVGMDETRATKKFPAIMEFILDGWVLDETGFFLCASIKDGHLISSPARYRSQAFYLTQTGYDQSDKTVVEDGMTTFRQILYGEVCECRAIIFAGHRIIAAIPLQEIYSMRTNFTAFMAIVLATVIGIFVMLLWRIDVASTQLKAFYKAEDEKRAAELELGRTIQMAALPSESMMSEYCALSASMQPAREVGGDFYDFFSIDETHVAFLVADVSGKGITGALYMMTKTIIKDSMLASPEVHPAEVLSQVNTELCRNNPAEMFLTAWVGVLDLNTGRVTFANAGHNPPIVRRSSGKVEWVKQRSGCPLACFDNVKYKPLEMFLATGDTLFLYTDGVTEAMDGTGALFGEERLLGTLKASHAESTDDSVSALSAEVRHAVEKFASGTPQADDITVLSMQYLAAPVCYVRTFPSNDSALGDAAAFLEEHLDEEGCTMKAKAQLLVALDEVISNIIRCSGASGIALKLLFSRKPLGLTMSVSDDGKPFDPLRQPLPDITVPLDERPVGGLGILLLRKTMDDLTYHYAHGCNILSMKKRF